VGETHLSSPPQRPAARSLWFLRPDANVPPGVAAFHAVLILVILSFFFHWIFSRLAYYQWSWGGVWEYREKFWRGWILTVVLSSGALIGSSLLGLGTALCQRSAFLPLRYAAKTYVELVRGTPLLVQILVLYYGVFDSFGLHQPLAAGILILSFFSGAYISEMIRAGIESIPASQIESARAVGFTGAQTYRFVIAPQALRQTLPPLAGQFASLIKDSSLLSIISISELTLNAREVSSFTLSTFESYLPLAAGYLILTMPISIAARLLERKMRYET
jgi:polar amino acid transport system permease protein